MLSFYENRWNFRTVKMLSFLNYLPIEIDLSTGTIKKQSNWIRLQLWKISYLIALIHSIYMPFRLVQSFIVTGYFYWEHFVFYFLFSTAYPVGYFWGYMLFIKKSEESTAIFNQLFFDYDEITDEDDENSDSRSVARARSAAISIRSGMDPDEISDTVVPPPPRSRSIFSWNSQYSRHELLALTLPEMLVGTAIFAFITLASDSTKIKVRAIQFLHTSLPTVLENHMTKTVLVAMDIHFMLLVISITYFSLLIKLLFVEKCEVEIQQLADNLKNIRALAGARMLIMRIRIIEQMLKEMKEFFVSIQLFNTCFPFIIFSLKIFCLSNAIVAAFVTIKNASEHPFLSCFTANLTLQLILSYSITFEKAHAIPREFEEMKEETEIVALESEYDPKTIRARIRAIPSVGIKVGNFHQLERVSTPTFIHFLATNLSSLLITFR